jgi:hypothetical protein
LKDKIEVSMNEFSLQTRKEQVETKENMGIEIKEVLRSTDVSYAIH